MRLTIIICGMLASWPALMSAQATRHLEGHAVGSNSLDPYFQAVSLADQRHDAAAMELLRPLARQGHARAGLLLGRMYANGWGVPANSDSALAWVRTAAARTDAEGQADIALRFLFAGDFPGYDETEALRWFRAAADRGSARGALGLGLLYHHGRGVPRDDAVAARWLRRAAQEGLRPAAVLLATLYDDPSSPQHNPAEAERILRTLVANHGPDLLLAWSDAYDGGAYQWYPVPVDRDVANRLRDRVARLSPASGLVNRGEVRP